MPESDGTYATQADFEAYGPAQVWSTYNGDELRRQIKAAEVDLDEVVGALSPMPDGATRKLNPTELTPEQRAALKRATLAQTLYRLEMGPEHFIRAQRERVTGRSFSAEGKLPIVGPQAERELLGFDIFPRTTSTGGRRPLTARTAGWPPDDPW